MKKPFIFSVLLLVFLAFGLSFFSCNSTPKTKLREGELISGQIIKMTNDYRLRYVGSGIFNVNTPRHNNFTEEEEGKVITVKMNNQIFYAFINNETGKSKKGTSKNCK